MEKQYNNVGILPPTFGSNYFKKAKFRIYQKLFQKSGKENYK